LYVAIRNRKGKWVRHPPNPCFVPAFYGISAALAVGFATTGTGGAVFPEVHEGLIKLAAIYQTLPEEIQDAVKAAPLAITYLGYQAASACK
jgi:hypothetical protein